MLVHLRLVIEKVMEALKRKLHFSIFLVGKNGFVGVCCRHNMEALTIGLNIIGLKECGWVDLLEKPWLEEIVWKGNVRKDICSKNQFLKKWKKEKKGNITPFGLRPQS